ncbi:listerin E3 ubiquitin protein ligase 1 [Bulinus truncatus]|nr:listerin E3 ubiquitin protein ligase 1 [Bulinus truncatus]
MPGPKKAPRSKGNVKPSSSSQAAQLLEATGYTNSGFIGFSKEPAFVPASEIFDDAEAALDGDIRLVLRKFSKRDTVTKIKALQEFMALCSNKDTELIKAVVPFWPRIYNKLAIDVDHKVRELTQKAHLVLVEKTGKCIAPHLKTIMGIWMVSMCDTYPTVASAANNAFTSTFTLSKQVEALIFCKVEIMECLMNNIMKATPQTLSDPQTTSEEDMEAKFERVVSSSLQALKKIILLLPTDMASASLTDQLTSLLGSSIFWKHSKSSVTLIKSATLSLLSAVCQKYPNVSAGAISKIAPFVISNLDTNEPLLLTYTWEATLSVLNAHEDCWNFINWQKAVWPKIKHILETGCCGQAGIISPCLLPLLSKIPNPNYKHFFDSFRTGLCEIKPVQSPSDINALVRSFIECIHYAIKFLSDKGNDTDAIQDLLFNQMLLVVEASLTEQQTGLIKTELFVNLGSLMDFVDNISPKTAQTFWSELSAFIAERLGLAYQTTLEKNIDSTSKTSSLPQIFPSIIMLVQGLVFREAGGVKDRVRFAQEDTRKISKKLNLGKSKCKLSPAVETFISDVFFQVFIGASVSQEALQHYMPLLKELSSIHLPMPALQKINENVTLDPAKLFSRNVEEKIPEPDVVANDEYVKFLNSKLVKTLLVLSKDSITISQVGDLFIENLTLTLLANVSYVETEVGTRLLLFILDNLQDVGMTCQFIEHLLVQTEYIPSCKMLIHGLQLSEYLNKVTLTTLNKEDADVHLKICIWKLFSTVLDTLDHCKSDSFTAFCVDIVLCGALATQKQLIHSIDSFSEDNVEFIINVMEKLLSMKEVWTHLLLGELVLNFISLILSRENEGLVAEFNNVWLHGFTLILEKKSDIEIQEHISTMSEAIKNKLMAKTVTHSCLLQIKNIVSSSARLVAVGQEHSQSLQVDFDLVALSNIIDCLLIMDAVQVATFKEVCNYYYLSNVLPYLPCDTKSTRIALESYALISIHNINTVTLYKNIQSEKVDLQEINWSEKQLLCLLELSHRLLVLEGAVKVDIQAFKDFIIDIAEMRKDLFQCFKTLTKEQLSSVIALALNRMDDDWVTYCFALQHVLDLLESDKTKVDAELLKLRSHFLTRLSLQENINIDLSNISEQGIQDASDLSLKALLMKSDISTSDLADCFSGWLSLAVDYQVLHDQLKDSFFQQVVNTVNHLKSMNIHLLSGGDRMYSASDLHWNIQVVKTLKAVMLPGSPKYWEFTLCSLVEWIQFLSEARINQNSDCIIKSLLVAVCDLSHLAAKTFSMENSSVSENSKTEWNEFFSEAVFTPLLQMFVSICADAPNDFNLCWTLVLETVASVIILCPPWIILSLQLPARLTVTDVSCLPDSLKTLLNHICPLLMFRLRSVAVGAYLLLWKIIDDIPKHDSGLDVDDKQDEETRSPPEALIKVIESAGLYLGFLKVIQIDDHIVMDRDTEEYAQTLGYLLAWKLLLQLFKLSTNQMRAKYAQYFKVSSSVNCLLDNLFRLMPQHPSPSILTLDCSINVIGELNDSELAWLSLCVYRQCLEILPALVRSWWVYQDRKAANFIDRFTTEYLSGGLIRQQILSAQNPDKAMEDITIKARPAAREVSATYQMAEVTINMSIVLPENYPLGKLEVTCDKRVGVSQAQWDRWLLQLNIFLQHQNGSIVDGLRLWKGNIDKKFEGIDDCMICFSVIHGTTFQLPRLTCRTCRKKFHSACLYKWFNTSQKSSCPLCRNLF